MNRRRFFGTAAVGGSSFFGWPLEAEWPAKATNSHAGTRKQETGRNPKAAQHDYYEFSSDGTECIIKRPDTPIPWMNILNNDAFQAWVTQRGYHECLMGDRGLNGLTNPQERSGNLYFRDHDSGEYFLLNHPPEGAAWECRQGLGYTTLTLSHLGLSIKVTYFVPRHDNALIWLIDVQNRLPRERRIDTFSTVEWSLGDQFKEQTFKGHGGGGNAYTGGSQYNLYKKVWLEDGVLYATQNTWKTLGMQTRPWPYVGFLASSLPVQSFDTQEAQFVGHGRTVVNPRAVEKGICSNIPFWSQNDYPWGVLHNRLTLPPNGNEKSTLVLGMARDKAEIPKLVGKYSHPEAAEETFRQVKTFWREFVGQTIHVETPEREIDRTVNVWTKYHWRSQMMRAPNSGLRSLGFWSYGLMGSHMGGAIREVVVQPHDLEIVRESIIHYFSSQQTDPALGQLSVAEPLMLASDLGVAWPPKPTRGPFALPHSHEINNIYPIASYIKETGELSILDMTLPYVGGGQGTLFEHMAKAIEFSLGGLSDRGLPRMTKGIGDWNDELNMVSREGRGESVMQAMELCYMLQECAEVARAHGREDAAEEWMQKYKSIKDAVNTLAWDGEWYVRAFADGQPELIPIGTHRDSEGKIYLNSQSWAVISGVADRERARRAMESVRKYLVSDYGPMILAPPYSKPDEHVGVQSHYAPGWRNACIYCRPAGWAIMAACLADLPDVAFDMYKKTCISERSKDVELYASEPYAYSENYVGPPHRLAGRAQYQWCLGEGANWMWHSYAYYILGVRPVLAGLLVDPKIPSEWKGFNLTRQFRGAQYRIEVTNPKNISMGVKSMLIDGKEVPGNVIPTHADNRSHLVRVVLA